MPDYNYRYGVVGLVQTPSDPTYRDKAQKMLDQYQWADTVYYETFPSYSGVEWTRTVFYDGGWTNIGIPISNGCHYFDTYDTSYQNYVAMTGKTCLSGLLPFNDGPSDPVAYASNRGTPTVTAEGELGIPESQTYIARISTAGVAGIAKCDILGPDSQYMSQDNVIYNGTPITMSGSLAITFGSNGPYYLHDSWAVKGYTGKVRQLCVDIDYEGHQIVERAVILFAGTTSDLIPELAKKDDTSDIVANSGISVTAANFGKVLTYGTDFTQNQVYGNNMHVRLDLVDDATNYSGVLHAVYVAVGDWLEYSHWDL